MKSEFMKMFLFTAVFAVFPSCSSTTPDTSKSHKNIFSITTKAELEKYLKEYKNVMVDFFGPWCGPCKRMLPIVEELAGEYVDKGLAVLKVDIDMARDLAKDYQVRGVPTLIYFKDQKNVHQHTGAISKEEFKAKFKEHFGI
jgi:thioredoxin 1